MSGGPPSSTHHIYIHPADTRSHASEYAQVVKMLGNGRLEAKCQDGETRLGQIRGQMRKKVSLSLYFGLGWHILDYRALC